MLSIVTSAKAQGNSYMVSRKEPLPSHALGSKNPTEAWDEIEKASSHFDHPSPEYGNSLRPDDPDIKYVESWFVATADKAQAFYKQFPNDTHAGEAKEKEIEALCRALEETYATNQLPRIFMRAAAFAKDVRMDKAKRFGYCNLAFLTGLTRRSLFPATIDVPAELEGLARVAEVDFRELGDVHLISLLVEDSKAEKARPFFRNPMDYPGMPGLLYRMATTALARQSERIGQPFTLSFTAVDGRLVNTAGMKGKVVVIDFWGTAYPECFANVLRLQKLYDKFHTQGLEVIGVNVDNNSESLRQFIAEHQIEWPQYWDGKEGDNKMVLNALVTRAGTILLVDKTGLLHDINGDKDLDHKIEVLLKK